MNPPHPAHGPRWTEYRPVADLPSAETNPKQHNLDGITGSIQTFALISGGIVLDERTGKLIGGHGTRDALLRLYTTGQPAPDGVVLDEGGTWTVPVQRGWASSDDAAATAAAVALNAHTITGGWNENELLSALDELTADNPALLLATGYDDAALEDLRALVDQHAAALGQDPPPPVDHYEDTPPDGAPASPPPDATVQPLARSFGVIIHAADLDHQIRLVQELTELGYRPATVG